MDSTSAMIPQRLFRVDTAEYPFASHWYKRSGCAMHFVDEGAGIPVVLCHGNPTWSYLYRNIIKSLSPQFRCIAADYPGFGFSDHPQGYGYTPMEHAEWLESLLFDHLRLQRFILVGQDWGGPIGLSVAVRHPQEVAGIVLSSTFVGPVNRVGRIFSSLMGSGLGQHLILQRNIFATRIVAALLGKRASPATLHAYSAPFPTPASRKGTAVFPVQLVAATPWLSDIEAKLPVLADKPVEFIFGMKDLSSTETEMGKWLARFPDAGVQRVTGANHYTQEDCPDCYVTAVERIASQISGKLTPAV